MVSFKKKYKAGIKSFLVGCATMLLFAMVLEQLVHSVVLGSAAGAVIQGNIWLYALYASLMAGLFEETGRLLTMRYVLKKEHCNTYNALMYGAGNGGFEEIMITNGDFDKKEFLLFFIFYSNGTVWPKIWMK